MTHSENSRVLYVVACAAPAASTVHTFVSLAKDQGWRGFVVGTPDARSFLDTQAVEAVTGDAIRVGYRMPDEPKGLPLADAVVVAPATFNTINKWATGVADNFAVALLCELTGFRVPTLAVPQLKDALARHPAFPRNLGTLRAMGVKVLFDPSAPHDRRMPTWGRVLAELETMTEDWSGSE